MLLAMLVFPPTNAQIMLFFLKLCSFDLKNALLYFKEIHTKKYTMCNGTLCELFLLEVSYFVLRDFLLFSCKLVRDNGVADAILF